MKKTGILCECAILLALSIALSYVTIYRMPMGGEITLVSMLPLLLVGVKHGYRWGLGTAFLFSMVQLLQGLGAGNVFPYCYTPLATVLCVVFDYLLPFTVLGLSGFAAVQKSGFRRGKILCTFSVLIFLRFLCHFVTGVVIWGQWAPEGMGKYVYSLVYNMQYMLPELLLTVLAAAVLTAVKSIRELLCNA